MNENLVGYLIDALDPEDRREVEQYLRDHPEGPHQLDLLRQALDPLAADNDTPEPQAGLWVRTLARVAEDQCRKLPSAPPVPAAAPGGRTWWRRADVLVAASVLFCLSLLAFPALNAIRVSNNKAQCAHNLRRFYDGLLMFVNKRGGGEVPRIDPDMRAGMFVPILRDSGALPENVSVACPSNGYRTAPDWSVEELKALKAADPERFAQEARKLSGCYAYSIGYFDGANNLHGLRLDDGADLPVMADRPLLPEEGAGRERDNSPNHPGGQNVLYLDGAVQFRTSRYVGRGGDDIYLNQNREPHAGLGRGDTVLGVGYDVP